MRSHEAEQAAEAVQRLDHRRDQRRIGAIARKNLTHGQLEAADQLLGFLAFLVGHVTSPFSAVTIVSTTGGMRPHTGDTPRRGDTISKSNEIPIPDNHR